MKRQRFPTSPWDINPHPFLDSIFLKKAVISFSNPTIGNPKKLLKSANLLGIIMELSSSPSDHLWASNAFLTSVPPTSDLKRTLLFIPHEIQQSSILGLCHQKRKRRRRTPSPHRINPRIHSLENVGFNDESFICDQLCSPIKKETLWSVRI